MDDLMPHEREIQRRRLAQAAAPATLPPKIPTPSASRRVRPVQPVEVVPMWECAGCKARVPRGEACPTCRKCLLEG